MVMKPLLHERGTHSSVLLVVTCYYEIADASCLTCNWSLVVVTAAKNLLAVGSKHECLSCVSTHLYSVDGSMATYVFTLCCVTALDIAKRGVGLNNTRADQVVQAQKVLVVAHAIEIPPAERQSTEVLGNGVEECLC